jgi:hypothetical protein
VLVMPRVGRKDSRCSYCTRCGGTGKRFRLGARLVHCAAAEAYRYARKRMETRP